MSTTQSYQVVIVGGGAGGLELAAKLGRQFGRQHIFLVDKDSDHIWKPSLHEVAAGTLDIHREGLSYFMLARDCGFTFIQGEMTGIDREQRVITLAPVLGPDHEEVFPERSLSYGTLVMAVGSKSNFFNTPGTHEHALALDSTHQAERFRLKLLNELISVTRRAQREPGAPLYINIVGGGATGVELAAELLEARADLSIYSIPGSSSEREVRITLLEGADRILSALPPKLSATAQSLLEQRGVAVRTSVRVSRLAADYIEDVNGGQYPNDLCVWAAGIEAPAFLGQLGLPVNRINQLVLDSCLATPDPYIWALGDCAQVPWDKEGQFLPARAQVAHQQASYLRKRLAARIQGKPVDEAPFVYKDYGSLVSVGHSRGVGSLMGVLSGKSWFVEGLLARIMYMSLHLMHYMAILGVARTATLALGRLLSKRAAPRVKLH
ncbi:NAD(P)/FAD-dependent oxidoreductase [Alcaligenes faecalis]|uniref:NAD(P)/FAD-dependent oxidoreductase n=1 Tax=Alcaligenes faecalis TaxID=511 RepID=UPI002932EBB7|nr:NAD(P)/FAD-dependent oxidoreductase [Alcaligenes faecalis]MDV2114941.1 NAD(P)/FAD-dependent oxidoreductase [Alcaligenes faecalis]